MADVVSWVLHRSGGVWLQREVVEKDIPSELLEDTTVTVAEDIRSGTAHLANGQACEASSTAEL